MGKMGRPLISTILLFILALISSSCGSSTSSAAAGPGGCRTIAQVQANGGWNIVTELPDYEPYWFSNGAGGYQGLDYDMLNEVNHRLGIPRTNYQTIPFDGVLPALQSKQSDFLAEGIVVTEERKKSYNFAYPEGTASAVLVIRPDSGIQSVSDLDGHTLGVVTGSAVDAILIDLASKQNFTIKRYPDNASMYLDLSNKRIDGAVPNLPQARASASKYPSFTILGEIGPPRYTAWVFRKEDMSGPTCVGTEVNRAISDLRNSGFLAGQQQKWLGMTVDLPPYDSWQGTTQG
jgi:polar amino acid transport system substrate-binding protein